MRRLLTTLCALLSAAATFAATQLPTIYDCDAPVIDTLDVVSGKHSPARIHDTLRIVCVGDMLMGRNWPDDKPAYAPNDGADLLKHVAEYLRSGDITAGNLEGVLLDSGGAPRSTSNSKYLYIFRMPERYVNLLTEVGFDYMNVANNHARDFGTLGLESTMRVLDKAGIAYSGVSGICETTVVERDGVRYGFCSFAPNAGMVSILDYNKAASLVRSLREEQRCDIVIATFHGGAEGSDKNRVPRAMENFLGQQRGDVYRFAHACVDAGADVVFGHGPHVVRGVELYKERLIAYSLGNFCTPHGINKIGRNGYAPVLIVEIDRTGRFTGGQIVSAIQTGPSGPVPDAERRVVKEMKNLSLIDFPESPLVIEDDGTIRRK